MLSIETLIESVGYLGVTAIIFAENGLLIGFFLPGDSLLFTAGFLASQGFIPIDIWLLAALFWLASVLGVSVGYAFGQRFGRRLFERPDSRFFKKENLVRAEEFYRRHGAKTIVLARFIPIVRTFAPIVAGVGRMSYPVFLTYNIVGGGLWAVGLTLFGYWLGGRIPSIDTYLLPIIFVIILLSVAPGIVHMLRAPERRRQLRDYLRSLFRRR